MEAKAISMYSYFHALGLPPFILFLLTNLISEGNSTNPVLRAPYDSVFLTRRNSVGATL